MTPIDRRSEILEQIRQCVCKDRCKTHGEAEVNLAHLADVWRWWIKARHGIDVPLDSLDSSQMMSLSKVSRKACNPYVVDHWADDAGYDVIGAGIVKKALDVANTPYCSDLAKELDGLAPAVDHGEEELKKCFQPVGKQFPVTSKTLDGKAAVLESLVNPIPPRCGHASDSGFKVGVCCLNYGHSGSHIYT